MKKLIMIICTFSLLLGCTTTVSQKNKFGQMVKSLCDQRYNKEYWTPGTYRIDHQCRIWEHTYYAVKKHCKTQDDELNECMDKQAKCLAAILQLDKAGQAEFKKIFQTPAYWQYEETDKFNLCLAAAESLYDNEGLQEVWVKWTTE